MNILKVTICSVPERLSVSSCVLRLRHSAWWDAEGSFVYVLVLWSLQPPLSVCHPSVSDNRDRLERDSTSVPLG